MTIYILTENSFVGLGDIENRLAALEAEKPNNIRVDISVADVELDLPTTPKDGEVVTYIVISHDDDGLVDMQESHDFKIRKDAAHTINNQDQWFLFPKTQVPYRIGCYFNLTTLNWTVETSPYG